MVNLVFLLYNAKVGENFGCKIMYGVKKAKGINVGETKISKLLSEINSEAQTKRLAKSKVLQC